MGGGGRISLTAWERGPAEPLACGPYSAPPSGFSSVHQGQFNMESFLLLLVFSFTFRLPPFLLV